MHAIMVATLALLQVPTNDEIDRELASWKPSKEDRVVPSDMYLVRDADFVGHWSNARSYGHIFIESVPQQENRFNVEISPDIHSWVKTTRSKARLERGVLILDKPIYEFAPIDRLYTIKFLGKIRLVSPKGWPKIRTNGFETDRLGFGMFTYGKQARQ